MKFKSRLIKLMFEYKECKAFIDLYKNDKTYDLLVRQNCQKKSRLLKKINLIISLGFVPKDSMFFANSLKQISVTDYALFFIDDDSLTSIFLKNKFVPSDFNKALKKAIHNKNIKIANMLIDLNPNIAKGNKNAVKNKCKDKIIEQINYSKTFLEERKLKEMLKLKHYSTTKFVVNEEQIKDFFIKNNIPYESCKRLPYELEVIYGIGYAVSNYTKDNWTNGEEYLNFGLWCQVYEDKILLGNENFENKYPDIQEKWINYVQKIKKQNENIKQEDFTEDNILVK